jgi:hypothetical protein
MLRKCSLLCAIFAAGVFALSASADITVSFNPVHSWTTVGGTVAVDIVADIPEDEAILGWGLDLTIDDPSIASWTLNSIGPMFDAIVGNPDGDLLGGLVPQPGNVWGTGVVLATIDFLGLNLGTTDLFLGDDSPGDPTEGFALDPTGFAMVNYVPGTLEVIPEPAALVLLAVAGLLIRRR